jgi:hypothetical protein
MTIRISGSYRVLAEVARRLSRNLNTNVTNGT